MFKALRAAGLVLVQGPAPGAVASFSV